MKNIIIPVLLFAVLFFYSQPVSGQEEIYQPTQIIEPLDDTKTAPAEKETKTDKTKKKPAADDAQTELEKRKENLNRIRLGLGNIGLQFGTFTYISANPTIGYMVIKDRLELGTGPILIYQRIRFTPTDALSFFVYGADVYARGFVWKGLNLEARYDLVNKPSYADLDKRINVHHLLLGAGYAAPIGKIGVFNIAVLFNVLNNSESIYRGTFGDFPMLLNMGFAFGLGGK